MDRLNRVLLTVGAPVGLAAVLGGAVAFAANSGGGDPGTSSSVRFQEGEDEAAPSATPKSGKHRGGSDCPDKGDGGGAEGGDQGVSPSAY